VAEVAAVLTERAVVVLESTVPVGTTARVAERLRGEPARRAGRVLPRAGAPG
jgi:UDP-N-acetyl-D-mannosaminuronate dehydrogenase